MIAVETTGGFWFQGRTRVFHYDIDPLGRVVFEVEYTCPSSSRGKVSISVCSVVEVRTVEQSNEGEPVRRSGARFAYLRRGHIELYAQKGGHAEACADQVLAQRAEAIDRVCALLATPPIDIILVLYEKPEDKTFDTGHLGAGFARGPLIVEVFNADTRLGSYHEIVHSQASAIGDPPAFICR